MIHKLENIDNIADYFIWFANEHGDLITHLKLQHLCYFAEAFHLAAYDEPLTGEPFEAWAHGGISRKILNRFKKFKHMPINSECADFIEPSDPNALEQHYKEPALNESIKKHLHTIINRFWGKSAWELEYIIHSHMPWIKARGNLDILDLCVEVIDPKDMTEFYKKYRNI